MSNRWGNAPPLATRRQVDVARQKVDVANTAFWEGKEYRISYEYSVGATPIVMRFECTKDFILQLQRLSCDSEAVRLRAYRSTQGTEGGTFGTVIPIRKVNFMSETDDVPTATNITTGGTFTPDVGEESVETLRLRTSNSTAQKVTVTGAVGDERGLAADVYYLIIERIDGSGNATGVFDLKWEERA